MTSPSRAEASYSSSSSLSTVSTQVRLAASDGLTPDLIILHGGLHVVVVRGVPGLVPCAALGCSRVLASSSSSPLQQPERDLAAEAADVLPFLADSRPAATDVASLPLVGRQPAWSPCLKGKPAPP